jgi:hypothetical protein
MGLALRAAADSLSDGPIGANHGFRQERSTMNAIFVAERGQTISIFFRLVIHH